MHRRYGIVALAFIAGIALPFCVKAAEVVRGAYPILTTPYLADGAVDYDSLVKEAQWVDGTGVQGIIWPQSDDSIDLLTTDEKKRGMTALAKRASKFNARLCLGVQGRGTDEMLELARHGESLAAEFDPRIVFISRPGDDCRTQEDLERYYESFATVASRPVIIQTYNGDKCPAPSVDLLVRLAGRHPAIYGWIKEEVRDGFEANRRMKAELAARPPLKTVFSAWGGWQWLYQSRRLGSDGVISERAALAPMLAEIWGLMETKDDTGRLDAAYAKYLLAINLMQTVPGDLRGYQLVFFKEKGIFKTTVSRVCVDKAADPYKWKLDVLEVDDGIRAEIMRRCCVEGN
ncbi:MAG: dihydrodipicolinate synthase family protein [Kiritimatiellae bacterium]|nr:dihydrodipicolinate synthase family protein [Kiritimatiellia bacterium]